MGDLFSRGCFQSDKAVVELVIFSVAQTSQVLGCFPYLPTSLSHSTTCSSSLPRGANVVSLTQALMMVSRIRCASPGLDVSPSRARHNLIPVFPTPAPCYTMLGT